LLAIACWQLVANYELLITEVAISMSVPPLRLGNNFDSYISGEVIIHPSAAIAPGVILQAAPNGKIIIGSGVCIGMGAILQVDQGTLEIEAGVNLGAGFLMVGAGKIGENACIGSATTVFHCSVERGQIVAPGSVVGDRSRSMALPVSTPEKILPPPPSTTPTLRLSLETTTEELVDIDATIETKNTAETIVPDQPETSTSQVETPTLKEDNAPESFGAHIYGQGSIQQLLITLFPHRQSLNQPISDDRSD
jgi:carbon dioxide concentrating mechanism protein CcmN